MVVIQFIHRLMMRFWLCLMMTAVMTIMVSSSRCFNFTTRVEINLKSQINSEFYDRPLTFFNIFVSTLKNYTFHFIYYTPRIKWSCKEIPTKREEERIKETDCLTPGFSFIFDQFVPHLHHLLNEPLFPASLLYSFLSCRNSSIDTTNEQTHKLYRTFAWTIKVFRFRFGIAQNWEYTVVYWTKNA